MHTLATVPVVSADYSVIPDADFQDATPILSQKQVFSDLPLPNQLSTNASLVNCPPPDADAHPDNPHSPYSSPSSPLPQLAQISMTDPLPHCPNVTENENDNITSDEEDVPWSQENQVLIDAEKTVSNSDSEVSADACKVYDQEANALVSYLCRRVPANDCNATQTVVEDHWSRLFEDFSHAFFNEEHDNDDDSSTSVPDVDPKVSEEQAQSQRHEGLADWEYASPFSTLTVSIDDVGQDLEKHFVEETNEILRNVLAEVQAEREINVRCTSGEGAELVSLMDLFNTFVSCSLQEKLRAAVNRTFSSRKKTLFTATELKRIIIFDALCSSYSQTADTITRIDEKCCFLQMGIEAKRYHEVWSALSFTM